MSLFSGNRNRMCPSRFALVVGNGRSGTTIAGSIIDCHPNMLCANETRASATYWDGLSRPDIVDELISNSEANLQSNRPSSGYNYGIVTSPKRFEDIDVIADKIWNPTLLLLHGNQNLLSHLEETLRCEVVIIHCIRNPFDVIATMYHRSGASLLNRTRWYFMHCEAAQALIERSDLKLHTVTHEHLIAYPEFEISMIYRFLGHDMPEKLIDPIRRVLMPTVRKTRETVDWPRPVIEEITSQMKRFRFLDQYASETSLSAAPAA
jgi:sulfotransferase family protein